MSAPGRERQLTGVGSMTAIAALQTPAKFLRMSGEDGKEPVAAVSREGTIDPKQPDTVFGSGHRIPWKRSYDSTFSGGRAESQENREQPRTLDY